MTKYYIRGKSRSSFGRLGEMTVKQLREFKKTFPSLASSIVKVKKRKR